MKPSVLVAGVGGASLGTEIIKCLRLSGRYNVFGADISPWAYGLYQEDLAGSFLVPRENYVENILEICKKSKIGAVIPGGEEPTRLLSEQRELADKAGISLAINSPEVLKRGRDKLATFSYLRSQAIPVPRTTVINLNLPDALGSLKYPCVIKPAIGTGGSVFVYLAEDEEEAHLYAAYLTKRGIVAMAQEYIPVEEGEYTVGVLSLPDGKLVGSIGLRRFFNAKLSYTAKYRGLVISSGYSQGLIDEFKEVRSQAEQIARKFGSRGPLNIQGRLHDGVFYPFEINPRFSATAYLRALAGFNEVDIFLQFLLNGEKMKPGQLRRGYYFRSLEEKYLRAEEIKR